VRRIIFLPIFKYIFCNHGINDETIGPRVSLAVFVADADETLLAGIVVGEFDQIVFAPGEMADCQFFGVARLAAQVLVLDHHFLAHITGAGQYAVVHAEAPVGGLKISVPADF